MRRIQAADIVSAVLKTFEPLTPPQIEQKIQLAASAFQSHRKTSFADRAQKMIRAAEILEQEKEECGRLMTLEMGKTLRSAIAEAAKDWSATPTVRTTGTGGSTLVANATCRRIGSSLSHQATQDLFGFKLTPASAI
jgi:delta 1-pyrroline-5-carboxylate dehydrogenase